MPDFQILEMKFNKATPDEKVYFRVERVGSKTLGGEKDPPYPLTQIAIYHAHQIKRRAKRGDLPTLLDKAAVEADTIHVEILRKDGLQDISLREANQIRISIIENYKEANDDWRERLLNINFS